MAGKTLVDNDVTRPVIRSRFSPSVRQGFVCFTPSMTLQDRKDECDIHRIVQRHAETGLWGTNLAPPSRQPIFGDFTQPVDLLTAQKLLCTAKESFAALPSEVRKEFSNDPIVMLEWLKNPDNRKRGEELGLLKKQSEQVPLVVTVPTDTITGSVPLTPNESEVKSNESEVKLK